MNLWFSSLVLVAGFFLSSSALSVEECEPLVTPLSTFDPSYGKWTFIMGYITTDPFQALFRSCQSMWIRFRKTTPGDKEFVEDIGIRHPSYCKHASSPVSVVRNTAVTDKTNFTCTYHSLPTNEDCLIYLVNSRNNNELLNIMDTSNPTNIHMVKAYRGLYMMGKKLTSCDEDLEEFMKRAQCLGFSGEPTFRYDPKHSLCSEDGRADDEEDDD